MAVNTEREWVSGTIGDPHSWKYYKEEDARPLTDGKKPG
jgi:hypothetical protein